MAGSTILGVMRLQGYQLLSVASDSMQPAIQEGNAVIISSDMSQPEIGWIISYRSPVNAKVIITHRVIAVDSQKAMIITKGDHAAVADRAIPASAVVGRVKARVPLLGYVLDGLRSPLGLVLAVYLPALHILAGEYRRLARYYTAYAPRRYVLYR